MKLTETQLSLSHILGIGEEHPAWHSSFPNKERECPFCETLEDLQNYFKGAPMSIDQERNSAKDMAKLSNPTTPDKPSEELPPDIQAALSWYIAAENNAYMALGTSQEDKFASTAYDYKQKLVKAIDGHTQTAIDTAVEQANKAYFKSVLQSWAISDPHMTVFELFDGIFQQKHKYQGASLTPPPVEQKDMPQITTCKRCGEEYDTFHSCSRPSVDHKPQKEAES